jgi:hypothetical protein
LSILRIDHPHQRGGRLAQLVERLVYTEDVGGSSPSSPTILPPLTTLIFEACRLWL